MVSKGRVSNTSRRTTAALTRVEGRLSLPLQISRKCLDRLGRSLKQLIEFMTELEQQQIGFQNLQESIDTPSPGGRLVFHIFGALAEFERELIVERTRAGLAAARARGRRGGRPYKMTPTKLRLARASMGNPETMIRDLCAELGVTRQTLYRHVAPDGALRPDGQKLLDRKKSAR
jgi:DNA invertase Pin-like site-specific DNA recombinase